MPDALNQARDVLLAEELYAWDVHPQRVRGGDDASGWWEDFWLIPHRPDRSVRLLQRYGQFAGLVITGSLGRLLWQDAVLDADASELMVPAD